MPTLSPLFNVAPPTTVIYALPLHDALPILKASAAPASTCNVAVLLPLPSNSVLLAISTVPSLLNVVPAKPVPVPGSDVETAALHSHIAVVCRLQPACNSELFWALKTAPGRL